MSEFLFNENNHSYTLDGKRLYGCTTVLGVIAKPALIGWAAKMSVEYIKENCQKFADSDADFFKVTDAVLEEAQSAHRKKKEAGGTKGTDVHAFLEEYVNLCITTNNGFALPSEKGPTPFVAWAIENKVKFLASERQIYSEKLWVAGTVDVLFEMNGKRYVGDFKTQKAIWDRTPFFQCAGYQLMLVEMGEEKFDGRCVIRIGEGKDFEVIFSESPVDERGFLAAVELFKALAVPVTEKQVHIKKAVNKKKYAPSVEKSK